MDKLSGVFVITNNNKKTEGGIYNMNTATVDKKPCSPSDSLKQSLKEMNLIRNDKAPKRTWSDFSKEIDKKG